MEPSPAASASVHGRALRVAFFQPALPRYRVPFFAALASDDSVSLRVYYSTEPALPNGLHQLFEARPVPTLRLGHRLFWQSAQVSRSSVDWADVTVLPWNTRYLSAFAALVRRRRPHRRILLWGHGYSKDDTPAKDWLRLLMGRLADGVVLYNHTQARRYVQRGIPEPRVFVAPNAIDQQVVSTARERWLREPSALARFQYAHGVSPSDLLLFVSRLHSANRLDIVIRALLRLALRRPMIRLAVIGDGDAERRRLSELAASLGLTRHILFLPGQYDETLLAPWFLSSLLFCYPANAGLSLLHAFGYGLPVAVGDGTRLHGPEIEAVLPGQNGLVFRSDDPLCFADEVEALLTDPERHYALSQGALQTAASWSLPRMVYGMRAALHGRANQRPDLLSLGTSRCE